MIHIGASNNRSALHNIMARAGESRISGRFGVLRRGFKRVLKQTDSRDGEPRNALASRAIKVAESLRLF